MSVHDRSPAKLYLATCNLHKVEELREMLLNSAWDVRAAAELDPSISWDETGSTFVENARIKARAVRQYTKEAVLADDSGLCVDALNGAPGVFSSRFADGTGDAEANMNKLLELLKDVPDERRTARFICCLVFIDVHGIEYVFEGKVEGTIASVRRGSHGFGYDPVFVVAGAHLTMAELPADEKNRISHRYRAIENWRAMFDRV